VKLLGQRAKATTSSTEEKASGRAALPSSSSTQVATGDDARASWRERCGRWPSGERGKERDGPRAR
jgi:hypothetical protein